ncbi:LAME_0H09648g1_1 [Lachancea meyersii CBS 8951]|uniref:LAME_0H09648g1_1 n=1 Tax=Lachancea meyersii CBS 8951 TaxID=1266667 RepID=A0A1G4KG65_9SACH|nr:LAME_0H09648g1_1 [Lachancea meyersii CBS 8951]
MSKVLIENAFATFRCLKGTLDFVAHRRFWASSRQNFQINQTALDKLYPRQAKSLKVSSNPAKNLRRRSAPLSSHSNDGNFKLSDGILSTRECTTTTTSEFYDLERAISLLSSSGYHPVTLVPDEIVTFKYLYNGFRSDIMVLGNCGTVVAWGLEETLVMKNILPLIRDARINALPEPQFESEDLDYIEIESPLDLEKVQSLTSKSAEESFIDGDLIIVNNLDPAMGLLDKAAFSSGMSRSTRLAVLEELLKTHIDKSRKFTELLSTGKKLNLTEPEVLKSTGSLFLIRGKLNLYSELIETPDLYWSEPRLERIYKQMSRSLDIQPRISILNSKLDFAAEESRAFMAVLSERKSTYLEWIIIYLITIEVCFELHHYYERYWLDRPRET